MATSVSKHDGDTETMEQLKVRAATLEDELSEVNDLLRRFEDSGLTSDLLPPPGKSGYLFKWQDRSIGWGGTGWGGSSWALRFVSLDRGRVSYYRSHLENAPRYTLSLRGCAVKDEGWKRNRRHTSKSTPKGSDPPLSEVGAYFFLFSIVNRPDSESSDEDEDEIVPLLRFSTNSQAEKSKWIQLLSEACAYCETEAFLKEEAIRNAEEEFRRQEQVNMAEAMPQAERGTLPALYFAKSKQESGLVKRPSLSKLPKATNFRSETKTKDAEKSEKKGCPPSKPMHRTTAPSFLSPEARSQNYRGFFNLAMIILVFSNFRLILNSTRKYGFVLASVPNLANYSMSTWEQFPVVSGFLSLQLFILAAYVIESLLAKGLLLEGLGRILHHLNAHGCLGLSMFIVWNFIDIPFLGVFVLAHAIITWMKLISYAHANEDYRLNAKSKDGYKTGQFLVENLDQEDMNMTYPRNITLGNMYYFWLAPTLTYQMAFPKTPRVRPMRVLAILLRLAAVLSISTFLIAQAVMPSLERLLKDLQANNGKYTYAMIAEYWLKLSIPNTYLWLLMFYGFFHLYLNLLAELLRFGDRVFYKDWWNSGEVSAYWRLWNLPVHYWLVRHLYFPCARSGFPTAVSTFVVFFFSAVLHEVAVSVPFHMVRPWAFLGMMGQIPLVAMTVALYRKFPGSSVGNIMFWISFCLVGQPMAILMYAIDYQYANLEAGDAGAMAATEFVGVHTEL